jgi:non-lysosomal glucosylceramidase
MTERQSRRTVTSIAVALAALLGAPPARAGDSIPEAAWLRPIGQPLANPGTRVASQGANHIDDGYWQGAPVGGFGAGTFSRSYRGDFVRWHVKAGVHKYETLWANQFAMYQRAEGDAQGTAQALVTDHPKDGALKSWAWDYPVGAGDYRALYPKSWYDYRSDRFPAHVVLEQLSPILPDNYKESSYPVAVYRWHAENPASRAVTVSVLVSWTNLVGAFRDYTRTFGGALYAGNFDHVETAPLEGAGGGALRAVVFDRKRTGDVQDEWDGQFAIATAESPGVEVTYQATFSPMGDGAEVWTPFARDGRLANSDFSWVSSGEPLAGALAVRFTLKPGEKRTVPMVIAWDLPVIEFGSGRKWFRRYTEYFGTSGTNVLRIAGEALRNASAWSDAIDAWQAPYVTDASKPLWYRGALFNELYILADGGSVWARPVTATPEAPYTFGFLECFDYPYYATLDVRFYGSLPLVRFWPDIDKQVLRQFAATVPEEIADKQLWIWKTFQTGRNAFRLRKAKGAVPHDLGVPAEDPFFQPNQFSWQDTNDWKDLNPKLVLMIYRDYVFTGRKDVAFLRETWPAVVEALERLKQYDHDGDGLPENDGYPDQTYDEWIVKGESAYCGGLYLASLRAAEEIAGVLGDTGAAARYHALFTKSQASYVKKLWNGSYFRYDVGSEYSDNVQSDQLAGQWYAHMLGLGDIVAPHMQRKALRTIFDANVTKFQGGEMGAVNGAHADGSAVTGNSQVGEVWAGTTFGLAALMLADGMKDEAYRAAWGVYHVTYETKGYWFRTPEAWDRTGGFRASMYMRPAAIWAMEMTRPPRP